MLGTFMINKGLESRVKNALKSIKKKKKTHNRQKDEHPTEEIQIAS